MKKISFFFMVSVAILLTGCKKNPPAGPGSEKAADSVFVNGKIYTVNKKQPWAEGVAIKDGKFIKVGTDEEIKGLISEKTEVIDLGGKFAMPGLIDAHVHAFEDYHKELYQLTLDQSSVDALFKSVKDFAEANPDAEWVTGASWPIGMFEDNNPHRDLLDAAVSDRPAMIFDQGFHSALLNTRALEICGILDKDFVPPDKGMVKRDKNGVPTGTISEYTIGYVRTFMPKTLPEEWLDTASKFQKVFHSNGITTVKMAAATEDHLIAVKTLADQGKLKLRILAALNYNYFDSPETIEEEFEVIKKADQYVSEFFDPRGAKLFLDGDPLNREGWLTTPYPGTESTGNANYTQEELTEAYIMMDKMGRTIMTHSIGDAANHAVLNAIESAQKINPDGAMRHHATHNSLLRDEDLKRFKELGIAAEFSPIIPFNQDLIELGSSILGREKFKKWQNARGVIDNGGVVAIASDWKVSPVEPWPKIQYVITRKHPDHPDMEPFAPGQALTLEEALRAYTWGAAYAINKEKETGSIEEGKYADMVLLDRNLFEIKPETIKDTKVLKAVFAGELVYELK
jgi:predicted amidohydrolase YtcJ